MKSTTTSKGRKATTTASKATPAKGRTNHAWTAGAPAKVVEAMRAQADAANVTAESLAALAADEATLDGLDALKADVDKRRPAVWAFVAASFGGRLPNEAGRMVKADSDVMADLKAPLMDRLLSGVDSPSKADLKRADEAARKAVTRARWAGILQAHPAMKGQTVAQTFAMACNPDKARATVTTGERADRKPRTTSGPKTPKAPKAPKVTPPAAPLANVGEVAKVATAATTENILKALDGLLTNVDKRNLAGSEREAFLAVMAAHGFAPALTAAATA